MKTLRPYQTEAVQAIVEQFRNVESTLLVLPTGTGKTVVFASLAKQWSDGDHTNGKPGNVLILAHRKELIFQAQNKVGIELGYDPAIEMAILSADYDTLFDAGMVVVGSVQTMVNDKRLNKYRQVPFDLLIIDEAHHAVAASYRKIINSLAVLNPQLKILGVTATPKRADDAALGIVFKTCAYELGIEEAINDGWLVPINQEFVFIDSVNLNEVGSTKNDIGETDFKQGELEAVMIENETLYGVAGALFEKAGDMRCLVFTAGVAHAHLLAEILNGKRAGCAAAVDGKTDQHTRLKLLADFRSGEIQFVCNFGVLTEGYDLPDIGMVAMARPTRSEGVYTQMLGRGTRPLDGLVDGPGRDTDGYPTEAKTCEERRAAICISRKPCVHILDFVGNSRHKLVSAVDVLGGNYDVEVRELAAERIKRNPQDVQAALEKAQKEVIEARERKRLAAASKQTRVEHSAEPVDPFGRGQVVGANGMPVQRGGASDSQVQFLVNLGVQRETALKYSKRQAGAVIDKLRESTPTIKQKRILMERGFPIVGVGVAKASEMIDAIAKSGWTLRYDSPNNPFKDEPPKPEYDDEVPF